MKRQNKARLLIPSILVVILGLTVGTHSTHLSAEPVASAEKLEGMKMEQCEDVMKLRQQLAEDIKTQDAILKDRIALMNSAPVDKKLGMVGEILTEIVEERTAMNVRKAQVEERMMQHMMGHMHSGRGSMEKCPLWQVKGEVHIE